MAYDHAAVFTELTRCLSANPGSHLGRVASDLRIERHTIEKIIREMTGESFRQYQKKCLVTQAIVLLWDEPRMSVKQVAVTLGYSASESFSRFVKEQIGASPSQIRKHRPKYFLCLEFVEKDQRMCKKTPQVSWIFPNC